MLTNNDYSTDMHGWAELLPAREAPAPLSGSHRVPWAVIGAGVTGLACARRLGELHPDDEILLLDARLVGQGASGRNSGFAVAVSHFSGGFKADKADEYRRVNRINQAGLDLLRRQVSENSIECQWQEHGIHHTAADSLSVQEGIYYLDYLNRLEIDHTVLDRSELKECLGTSLYETGLHVPSGALLQPAALVRGLADKLPINVKLAEKCPVLKVGNGASVTLHLSDAEINADKIVLATNYEAGKLGFLQRYVLGSTLSGSMTRVLNDEEFASLGNVPEWGVLSLHPGGATLRLTNDRRLNIRNAVEYHGGALLGDEKLAQRQAIHRAGFDKRFPQLAHVPFEFSWSGVEGISRNSTNFFGRQRENVFLAGGYNGSGLSRGTAFGTALAEFAGGGQSPLITDCLACAPGSWMPPRPLLDIGAFFTVRSRFRGVGLDR